MPKSITAVLLDRVPEGEPAPLKRFQNHADHMHRFDGITPKKGARAKYAKDIHALITGKFKQV